MGRGGSGGGEGFLCSKINSMTEIEWFTQIDDKQLNKGKVMKCFLNDDEHTHNKEFQLQQNLRLEIFMSLPDFPNKEKVLLFN